jgi:hypothetical protein
VIAANFMRAPETITEATALPMVATVSRKTAPKTLFATPN